MDIQKFYPKYRNKPLTFLRIVQQIEQVWKALPLTPYSTQSKELPLTVSDLLQYFEH